MKVIAEPTPAVLTARPVETLADINLVRIIRNQSLDGMTRNAYPTTDLQQLRYWFDHLESLRAWLYTAQIFQVPERLDYYRQWVAAGCMVTRIIGYASLRRAEDGRLWSFMTVAPEFRGQGYGREIQRHHVRQTNEDVYDEILEGNAACLRMTASSGDWRVIERRDGLVYQVSEHAMREGK